MLLPVAEKVEEVSYAAVNVHLAVLLRLAAQFLGVIVCGNVLIAIQVALTVRQITVQLEFSVQLPHRSLELDLLIHLRVARRRFTHCVAWPAHQPRVRELDVLVAVLLRLAVDFVGNIRTLGAFFIITAKEIAVTATKLLHIVLPVHLRITVDRYGNLCMQQVLLRLPHFYGIGFG